MKMALRVVEAGSLACLMFGCVSGGRIEQPAREIPEYADGEVPTRSLRLSVYPHPDLHDGLSERLANAGHTLVRHVPTTGAFRPDLLVEPLRCVQNFERNGLEVALITVLVVRVRRPGALAEDGASLVGTRGARSFQAVSRIPLGAREFNDERLTEAERKRGVVTSLDNLMKIPAFLKALNGGTPR